MVRVLPSSSSVQISSISSLTFSALSPALQRDVSKSILPAFLEDHGLSRCGFGVCVDDVLGDGPGYVGGFFVGAEVRRRWVG